MDPVTIVLIIIALFILFLMLTTDHRRHRLQKVLSKLQAERLRLMKSIEHVKLSFYHKKIDEKEAQDKIFEYEEKLREVQDRMMDIKEKPLMRTIKKHEMEDKKRLEEESDDVRKSEKLMLANVAAKSVVLIFVIIVVIIMAASALLGVEFGEAEQDGPAIEEVSIPITVTAVPVEGTYPGSSAGLRVEMTNTHDESLESVRVLVRAPEGSGISFREGEVDVKIIPELETGGSREVYFPMTVGGDAEEGEYVIEAEVSNEDDRLRSAGRDRLMVRIGTEEQDVRYV